MNKFVDLDYVPKKEDLICEFSVEPSENLSMKEACNRIAKESSIGTWTHVEHLNKEKRDKLRARVYSIDGNTAKVAYPPELFEKTNVPGTLASIAGNIFGMKALKNLRLEDVYIPASIDNAFEGPRYGIKGIRDTFGIEERPLIGTIVKPKVGLSSEQHANIAFEAWKGGCDVVKDDENLVNQDFNKFEERLDLTLEKRKKAEEETSETKGYMPNVTAETEEMLKRAELVKEKGGRYMMIDIVTAGWSALQTLRKHGPDLRIHAHRAMHAALTKNKKHGISMLTIAKFARLIGVDQLHIGTAVGKMEGEPTDIWEIEQEVENKIVRKHEDDHVLAEDWRDIKPVFAVSSGGLHPGLVQPLMQLLGKNIIIQAGGGIHGHPDGTRAGARAMRQAIDARMKGIDVEEYAEDSEELKKALDLWGAGKTYK